MKIIKIFALSLLIVFQLNKMAVSQSQYYVQGDSIFQIYRLQEVLVYGSREQIPSSMLVEIDQQQMQARNSITVSELLKFEPGLNLTSGYKGESETRIRGFRSHDVLVLVDGRPVNPGYYGRVDLSMLPLDNLAKITIIKGPASVAFGANSMGGVINIVTHNGLENSRTVIETKLGKYQFRRLNLNHSQQIGQFNYWISGYEHHANGFRMSDKFQPNKYENGGMREMSFYHKMGISSKLGYQHSEALLITVASEYHWAKKDIPVAIRFVPGIAPRYWRFPNWERYSGTISSEWKTDPRLTWKSVLFADAYNDRLIEYKTSEMTKDQVEWNSLLKNFTIGGLIHGHYRPSKKHQLLAGIQFRQDRIRKKADEDKPWEDHFALTGSLFLQDDFQPWKNTTLTLGVGYHFHQIDIGNANGKFSPMLSLQQQFPDNWKLFSSYSHTVRFPTLHKLYGQTSGNPELRPESADKIELGFNKIFFFRNRDQYFSADLALFYNKMNDLIYRTTRSLRYKNISQAAMQGVEVRTNWSLHKYFAGEFSYSFIAFPQTVQDVKDYLPTNKVRLMFNITTDFGTTLNYEVNFIDDRQFYYTREFEVTLPDYFVHNVNIIQALTKGISLRLEGTNLLDKYYEEEFGYPQPGRQIMGGIRVSF